MTPLDRNKPGEWLSAYLDGELDAAQSRAVEAWLGEDESARRLLQELQRTVELVRELPRRNAPASIADDLQLRLERSELLDAAVEPARRSDSRIALVGRRFSAAAMLALVVLGGWWVMHDTTDHDSDMVAKREGLTTAKELHASRALRQETGAAKQFETLATFAQKLAMGIDEATLRRHHFSNESIHLTLASRDADRRDGLVADMLRDLRGSEVSRLGTITSEADGPGGAKSSVYFEGKVGVNFAGKGKRVVLVHASGKQLERLLKRLGRASASLTGVTLAVNSARFQGSKRVRGMLAQLVGAESESALSFVPSIDSAPRTDRPTISTDPQADTTVVRAPLPSIEDLLRHLGFHSAAPIGPPGKAGVVEADPASVQEGKAVAGTTAADVDSARDPIDAKSAVRKARSYGSTMAERQSLVDRRMVELEKARGKGRRASGSASRESSDASEAAPSSPKKSPRRSRRRSAQPSGQPDRSIPTVAAAPNVARSITIVIEFTAKELKPVKRRPDPPPPVRKSQNRSRTGPSAQAR